MGEAGSTLETILEIIMAILEVMMMPLVWCPKKRYWRWRRFLDWNGNWRFNGIHVWKPWRRVWLWKQRLPVQQTQLWRLGYRWRLQHWRFLWRFFRRRFSL